MSHWVTDVCDLWAICSKLYPQGSWSLLLLLSVLFAEPLIPLVWTSGDVCPWFQIQGGSHCLCTLSPVHNGIVRFTSGATPADLLAASMTAEQFSSTYFLTPVVLQYISYPFLKDHLWYMISDHQFIPVHQKVSLYLPYSKDCFLWIRKLREQKANSKRVHGVICKLNVWQSLCGCTSCVQVQNMVLILQKNINNWYCWSWCHAVMSVWTGGR